MMRDELYLINNDILKKIDSLDIEDNKKIFLKKALLLQYKNRDIENEDLEEDYRNLVENYYGGGS